MKLCARILMLGVFLFSFSASALKVQLPPGLGDAALNLNVQLQGWIRAEEAAAPDGTSLDTRALMRRSRLIISGDLTKKIHFFFNIDGPNVGRFNGAADPAGISNTAGKVVVLQDARLTYEPIPGIFIAGGFLIIPLSHHIHQSTLSYTTIDTHAATLRFQQTQTGNSNVAFREPGLEVHGWLLDKRVGFRAGAYNGVRGASGTFVPGGNPNVGLNPGSAPRVAGYVHFNFFESEERGFLYQGIYFTDKPILGVGAGANWQPKSVRAGTGTADYRGFAADAFLEWPMPGDQAVNANFSFYNYDFGTGHPSTGNGFFGDLAYRFGEIQPIVSYEYFAANTQPGGDDVRIWTAGVNWWISKTTTNLKLEFQDFRRGNLAAPTGTPGFNQKIVTLAGQLFW